MIILSQQTKLDIVQLLSKAKAKSTPTPKPRSVPFDFRIANSKFPKKKIEGGIGVKNILIPIYH